MDGSGVIDSGSVERLGDLVTVWAHPDDESYLAGGLMAAAAAAGARVTCVVATRGERGGPPDLQAEIAWRREEELRDALAGLGVDDVVVLGLPDGACARLDPAGPVAALTALVDDRAPDTVVTFGPDGHTGHGDHRAVSAWVGAAVAGLRPGRPRLLHTAVTPTMAAEGADIHARFSVYEPGLPALCRRPDLAAHLQLDGRLLDAKVRALRAHASQTHALEAALAPDRYRTWVATEAFVDAPPG
jgi:LmbE family N-acetylglucosaminyl deacetylase